MRCASGRLGEPRLVVPVPVTVHRLAAAVPAAAVAGAERAQPRGALGVRRRSARLLPLPARRRAPTGSTAAR
jgi:hypothetical protein